MPRVPRLDEAGLPQHVVLRGHDRKPFLSAEIDRRVCLRYLEEALAAHDCLLHAFVLMDNHVHLLVTGMHEGALSEFMHAWSRRFSHYFNRSRGRSGSLYEGRFRSDPVRTDRHFHACMRYIEMNPVRAGMVGHPRLFAWSSFSQNASGAPSGLLTPHECYLELGATPEDRRAAYRALFEEPMSDAELESIRAGIMSGPPGRRRREQPNQPGT
jgi:putative transposase